MVRGKQTSADNLSIPSSSDDNASASDTLLEKLPSPYEKKQQPFWREHRGLCMATIATFIFLILLILVQLEYNRKLEGQIRKSLVHCKHIPGLLLQCCSPTADIDSSMYSASERSSRVEGGRMGT